MIRPLPEKLLIAYTTTECYCNHDEESPSSQSSSSTSSPPAVVRRALRDGVNVLIWSFFEITPNKSNNIDHHHHHQDDEHNTHYNIHTNSLGNLNCIKQVIHQLDREGYTDTIHLTSFGGWNGPHLDSFENGTARQWYQVWKEHFGNTFHGIDWDFEGHDNVQSPTNEFSMNCLDKMGRISQYASMDGYRIGVAPPQSYLDISNHNFSRRVNLTRSDQVPEHDDNDGSSSSSSSSSSWHDDFPYHGANVYAYLLAKYGAYVDFVSIQFYESYSRAGRHIHHHHLEPAEYLQSYVNDLVDQGESFAVNFSQDPDVQLPDQRVALPLSKLVWGFANGWALNKDIVNDEKTVYFSPASIEIAYRALMHTGRTPRGCMFWVINEEGTNGIHYAPVLHDILHLQDTKRPSVPQRFDDGNKGEL